MGLSVLTVVPACLSAQEYNSTDIIRNSVGFIYCSLSVAHQCKERAENPGRKCGLHFDPLKRYRANHLRANLLFHAEAVDLKQAGKSQ
jgi:hypothetical protein